MCRDCNCACTKPTTIDWTKPVRDKRYPDAEVRVLCTDAKGTYPIVTLVDGKLRTFTLDGLEYVGIYSTPNVENIPPEKKRAWVNIYPYPYTTKATADHFAHSDRVACVEVEFTEGEGL